MKMIAKELIQHLASIYQLKDVIRYNTRKHIKDESVAEHSFYVALMSLELCDRFNLDERIAYKCIVKALLHDMPEIELNDITHNVKERLNLRPLLKTYEDNYYKEHFPKHAELMSDETDSLVNLIVKYSDALSVVQYCANELELGNKNPDITNIIEEADKRLSIIEEKLRKFKI